MDKIWDRKSEVIGLAAEMKKLNDHADFFIEE